MYKIKQRLKDKKAANQSIEYVLYFALTVIFVLIFINIIFAFSTIYQAHVTSSTIARSISVNGGCGDDTISSEQLYNLVYNQIGEKTANPDNIVIKIYEPNDSGDSVLTGTITANDAYFTDPSTGASQNGNKHINLGDQFAVYIVYDLPLISIADNSVSVTTTSGSNGVSEVYWK